MNTLIIAGSRTFNDFVRLEDEVNNFLMDLAHDHSFIIDSIMSGTARGADRLGEKYARFYSMKIEMRPADWKTYGRAAGHRRNAEMANEADALIAFWDGESPGTKGMISLARNKGLYVRVINLKEEQQ